MINVETTIKKQLSSADKNTILPSSEIIGFEVCDPKSRLASPLPLSRSSEGPGDAGELPPRVFLEVSSSGFPHPAGSSGRCLPRVFVWWKSCAAIVHSPSSSFHCSWEFSLLPANGNGDGARHLSQGRQRTDNGEMESSRGKAYLILFV